MPPLSPKLGRRDLVASHYSMTGAGPLEPARTAFGERVKAAAAAGFAGIGLEGEDYRALLEGGLCADDMQRQLEDAGLVVDEIALLVGWSREDAVAAGEEIVWELAERFRPRLVAAIDMVMPGHTSGATPPLDVLAARFGSLCDRAAERDLVVGLEFLGWTAVGDAATAAHVVSEAGRDNAGVIVDAWHFYRGGGSLEDLRKLPAERIVSFQIDDGSAEPVGELWEDTSALRVIPGEGDFDLVGLIRTLDEMGVEAPVCVEILGRDFQALPLHEALDRAATATRRLLAEARPGGAGPP